LTSIQHGAPGGRTRRSIVLAILAAVVLLGAVVAGLSWAGSRRGLVSQLARATLEREFAPRMSIPTRYHTCTVHTTSQDTVPREECGEADEGRLVPRKFIAAGASAHPDSLHGSALAGLIWWDREDASLDAGIEHLNTALRLSPNSVPLRVDLSAAHLVRAERTQNSRDLLAGVEFAYQALSLEPRNEPARFNAALGLQLFGLDVQAGLEWDAFLAVDSKSRWASEARERKGKLIVPTPVAPPSLGASPAEVDSFARQHPQQAREYGFHSVLGEWGTAVEKGHRARADSLLNLAERLGRGLERRQGGDRSLIDAVRAIREASRDAAATLVLARAHQAYAEGQFHLVRYADGRRAMDAFRRVVEARPPSPVLVQWAMIFNAGALLYRNSRDEARVRLMAEVPHVDSVRYPALAGRARAMLGTALARPGAFNDGRAILREAVLYLERAGEDEYAMAALSTYAELSYELGDTLSAYGTMHHMLRTHRGSSRPHRFFVALGRVAERDGFMLTAWAIHNEDLAVAPRPRRPFDVQEAYQARADVRSVVGDTLGAQTDLASAAAWLDRIPHDHERKDWPEAMIRMARREPVTAEQMDSTVEAFADNVPLRVPALIWRAEQMLEDSNSVSASKDLQEVTQIAQGLTRQQRNLVFRGAMMEQARSSFDRLVMLYLRRGQLHDALRTLEAGRMSFAPRRESRLRPDEGRLAAPPGQVAVEYALIGDTLLSWTIGDSIRLWVQPLDRDTFQLTVERANAALELSRAPTQALRRLYDWLIRPIRPHLGSPETQLVIMADGEVAGVPFPALMDGDRYLIQDYPLRFAATLEDAARAAPRRTGPVLLVGNPRFDTGQYPTLDPLPWASEEVASLASRYRNVVRLQESAATRDAFVAQMQRASMIHYAGHAVFDDARPERSYLLLAGDGDSGRLTADAVSTMRLRGSPLVVLSACSTLRSHTGRSGGFAGLSGALLAAGGSGVVGSLWEVSDKLTQPLMEAFHRHLDSLGPARALRNAQLDMLRSTNPDEASPSAWAGFRYTGS
jgi:CHAT domain-containing protein